eukprot:TRINITY_DN19658_c0_g1_i1.p1 TRINITY_DN19658_c0_g1~~TRINITY_DN19658_c0_g1_i1.p1  ORF type:complete len:113 (+),score=2.74 TRINITY_DN19658_c0_g1_i1:54-392(+)
MAKNLVRLFMYGVTIISRSFTQAMKNESSVNFHNQSSHLKGGHNKRSSDVLLGISLKESKQILNLQSLNPEELERNFNYLFKINDKNNGGSFYIQSKVFRAKERIELEVSTN